MKETKDEMFGSRRVWLESILLNEKVRFIKNIWFATCRRKVNSAKDSRYVIFMEEEIFSDTPGELVQFIHDYIPICQVRVEDNNEISYRFLKDSKISTVSNEEFRDVIVDKMDCEYRPSKAKGSDKASKFSNFFRKNMGKAFSLTDIDYFIPDKNLLIEEKNFYKENELYIGVGQCYSFKEVINDVFIKSDLIIIGKKSNDNSIRVGSIETCRCNQKKYVNGWGDMVPVNCTEKSLSQLINYLKDN